MRYLLPAAYHTLPATPTTCFLLRLTVVRAVYPLLLLLLLLAVDGHYRLHLEEEPDIRAGLRVSPGQRPGLWLESTKISLPCEWSGTQGVIIGPGSKELLYNYKC